MKGVAGSEADIANVAHPSIGVEHFDLAFFREVDLCLVAHSVSDLSRETESGVAHFKTSLLLPGLIFILATNGPVDVHRASVFLLLGAQAE